MKVFLCSGSMIVDSAEYYPDYHEKMRWVNKGPPVTLTSVNADNDDFTKIVSPVGHFKDGEGFTLVGR